MTFFLLIQALDKDHGMSMDNEVLNYYHNESVDIPRYVDICGVSLL